MQKEGLTPVKQEGDLYQCVFYVNGKRKRKSTGEREHGLAWVAYQDLRRQHGLPSHLGSHTLGSILAEYEQHKFTNLRSPRAHTTSVNALFKFWHPTTAWTEIARYEGQYAITEYKRWRSQQEVRGHPGQLVKMSTIRRELAVLSAAAEHAIRKGHDIRNPRGIIELEVKPVSFFWLSVDQSKRLLEASREAKQASANDYALYDYIKIGLYTGFRPGEILGLTIDRVSFEHNSIKLAQTKSNKTHDMPIAANIADCLRRRIAFAEKHGSRLLFVNKDTGKAYDSFRKPFRVACKAAHIPVGMKDAEIQGCRVYDLRHTFASWSIQSGMSLAQLCDLMNHSDIKTTMIYAHLAPDTREQALKGLPDV